tara:strand:- start:382 stop:756 length:375 start_codon:yes stop_codon:yes gene_type:complete
MANRFTGIPAVPLDGLTDWQSVLIGSMKENVELLTGLRGEADVISKAVTQGQVTLAQLGEQNMRQVTAQGTGFEVTSQGTLNPGTNVPNLEDVIKLINDVQVLANDLAQTRAVINVLLKQLQGK